MFPPLPLSHRRSRAPAHISCSHGKVEKEAAELDWTQQSGGRTVAGRAPGPRAKPAGLPDGGGGYVLVKDAFEGGSGRLGGDSSALTHVRVRYFLFPSLVLCVLGTGKGRVGWHPHLLVGLLCTSIFCSCGVARWHLVLSDFDVGLIYARISALAWP